MRDSSVRDRRWLAKRKLTTGCFSESNLRAKQIGEANSLSFRQTKANILFEIKTPREMPLCVM